MYQSYTPSNAIGLPETYVFVAGYDILRDEGLLFAKRLNQVRLHQDRRFASRVVWTRAVGTFNLHVCERHCAFSSNKSVSLRQHVLKSRAACDAHSGWLTLRLLRCFRLATRCHCTTSRQPTTAAGPSPYPPATNTRKKRWIL